MAKFLISFLTIFAVGFLTACALAQGPANQGFDGLYIGMPIEDIVSNSYNFSYRNVQIEGENYQLVDVVLKDRSLFTISFDTAGKTIVKISTKSEKYRTEIGARIGMTMTDLLQLYPEGELYWGYNEGKKYFFKTNRDNQTFVLDARELSQECLEQRQPCTEPEMKTKTIEFFVY